MQSFLQYRRLRKAAHAQVCDANAAGAPGIPTPSHTCTLPTESLGVRTNFQGSIPGINVQTSGDRDAESSLLFIVTWASDQDAENPRNFSMARRLIATLLVSILGCVVGVASSVYSGVAPQNAEAFGVSEVAASLVTGIYLLGFAAGSLVSGPLSEVLGRNLVYVSSLTLFIIFVMASALAPNFGAQLAFRFLSGVFGCPPLTCAGGTIADLWNPLEKTTYFPMYAIISFCGPAMGPLIASYIGQTDVLSWRWAGWIVTIMSGAVLVLIVFFQPETYSPLLLSWRAKHLRAATGDGRFRCEMDVDHISLVRRIGRAMKNQFLITIHEPIVLLISLYMTVVYIVLFTFLDGYAYIYTDVHGLSQGLTNIIWVAMVIGIVSAAFLVPPAYIWTRRLLRDNTEGRSSDGFHIQPEQRLWYAMLGAPLIPISLFWMAWTDFARISVWSPIIASAVFGLGTICIFISSYMYVIDCYHIYAASALAFMTVSRYAAAGVMTVVGIPFYRNMGVQWTLTILGCISAALVPVPFVFYCSGPTIRKWSKFAESQDSKV
ncbi:uncharacterized protein G6M90_00g027980 [Metarhizium brunneum]|uniref:Major facilitator superfamily (MFS) profile domain-containing protein n=1 Tax=Metarhizium brunneum TaxID=500148 RepID=A0A7D5USK4_9HYPO